MDAAALTAIGWRHPAFAPYALLSESAGSVGWRKALSDRARAAGIRTQSGMPIEFVAADDAAGTPYEAHIASTGRVPSRDNLHDRFNAIVWLTLPRLKARLNALQADVLARDGAGARRGALRDAATILDEQGLLLVSSDDSLFDCVRDHAWKELFVSTRSNWSVRVRAIAFGHGLLEKMIEPYKALTAHALPVRLDAVSPGTAIDRIDTAASALLNADFSNRALLPIPVLGIPGWSAANEDPCFYEDKAVFRPVRPARRL